jgi:hypothetical protein
MYAVSSEFDTAKLLRNPWLVENVWASLPKRQHPEGMRCRCLHGHLDLDHPDVRPRAQIARLVTDFVQATRDVELWADYAAYDHVALCQLYGTMMQLPDGFPMWTHDFQQAWENAGRPALPEQTDGLHNALADARHLKVQWESL